MLGGDRQMKSVHGLGYYVHSGKSDHEAPVLLFLHGVGECFFNEKNRQQIGPKSLFEQSVPKRLADASPDHPLRTSFILIAPQLPDRETPWINVVDELKEILVSHCSKRTKLYIIGFSKGGLGAFQVSDQLRADAMVTIDASPMNQHAKEASNEWVKQPPPFWAIHTSYRQDERFRKIQDFNELLTQQIHKGLDVSPAAQTRSRTCEPAPTGTEGVERHVWICDQASTSAAPYHWLLQHG
jgi:predicted peptidase